MYFSSSLPVVKVYEDCGSLGSGISGQQSPDLGSSGVGGHHSVTSLQHPEQSSKSSAEDMANTTSTGSGLAGGTSRPKSASEHLLQPNIQSDDCGVKQINNNRVKSVWRESSAATDRKSMVADSGKSNNNSGVGLQGLSLFIRKSKSCEPTESNVQDSITSSPGEPSSLGVESSPSNITQSRSRLGSIASILTGSKFSSRTKDVKSPNDKNNSHSKVSDKKLKSSSDIKDVSDVSIVSNSSDVETKDNSNAKKTNVTAISNSSGKSKPNRENQNSLVESKNSVPMEKNLFRSFPRIFDWRSFSKSSVTVADVDCESECENVGVEEISSDNSIKESAYSDNDIEKRTEEEESLEQQSLAILPDCLKSKRISVVAELCSRNLSENKPKYLWSEDSKSLTPDNSSMTSGCSYLSKPKSDVPVIKYPCLDSTLKSHVDSDSLNFNPSDLPQTLSCKKSSLNNISKISSSMDNLQPGIDQKESQSVTNTSFHSSYLDLYMSPNGEFMSFSNKQIIGSPDAINNQNSFPIKSSYICKKNESKSHENILSPFKPNDSNIQHHNSFSLTDLSSVNPKLSFSEPVSYPLNVGDSVNVVQSSEIDSSHVAKSSSMSKCFQKSASCSNLLFVVGM